MKKIVIKRLFQSFVELDRAIASAKAALLSREDRPNELLERIKTYEQILDKQRSLATSLCGHASLGNWNEVARHIKLINGLSFMIRDDAREILAGASKPTPTEERAAMLC
ncbi:MAG: hypothetical protein KDD69_11645 [Bdellovibrionales bacterium]|nr:hypothetical protein [Bdellovibrionales bacterium]